MKPRISASNLVWIMGILVTFLICPSLRAEEDIVVDLKTRRKLNTAAIAPMNAAGGLKSEYLTQLTSILMFDCNHSGRFKVLRELPTELQQLCHTYSKEKKLDPSAIKPFGVDYLLFPTIQEVNNQAHLVLEALALRARKVQHFRPIILSGDLNHDRRLIHKLADALLFSLFQETGIASTHLLYSLKIKSHLDPQKWFAEVWECDYDGGNAHPITRDHHLSFTPVYIPPQAGKKTQSFLYTSYCSGVPKLFFGTLHQGRGPRVSFLKGNQFTPAISPQADAIAFISDALGTPDLYLQSLGFNNAAPVPPKRLFGRQGTAQASPTFSPDGGSLAFVSDMSGSPKIYHLRFKGTKEVPTLLTKVNRENTSPSWSPDGKKLAYSARNEGGMRQLWILDLASGEEQQLTTGSNHKENPSWSPNSRFLVYNQISETTTELAMIDVEFPDRLTVLTSGEGEKLFPCWEPR